MLAKAEAGLYKAAIGKAAINNKFLNTAIWYDLKLKSPIWHFSNVVKEEMKSYDKFGGINADNMRTIAVVGNALGMFTDGVKQPIPKTLFMNDTNVSVTLAMLGLGLKPEMAIAFNFIPEVINAGKKVEESRTGISNEVFQNQLFYGSVLSNIIDDTLQADKNNPMELQILPELFAAGLLDSKRNPRTVPLNMENLSIEFTPNKLDAEKIKMSQLTPETIFKTKDDKDIKIKRTGTVTTEDIGFKVSSRKTGLPLSERAHVS